MDERAGIALPPLDTYFPAGSELGSQPQRKWSEPLHDFRASVSRNVGRWLYVALAATTRTGRRMNRNRAWAWDRFNPVAYFQHNYGSLRPDDRQILVIVRDFFVGHFTGVSREDLAGRRLQGLDIGSGSNLYPALTMLPFCHRITLRDFAPKNVRWMRNEVRQPHGSWTRFWRVLAKGRPYRDLRGDYVRALSRRAVVQHGSIFDLHKSHWDLGTMFFVAESLTMETWEFEYAVTRFVESLRDGAPFACAFMRNSSGYRVGIRDFPAVAIDEDDVQACLNKVANGVKVHVIELKKSGKPLRDGYGGMIVATGRRGHPAP